MGPTSSALWVCRAGLWVGGGGGTLVRTTGGRRGAPHRVQRVTCGRQLGRRAALLAHAAGAGRLSRGQEVPATDGRITQTLCASTDTRPALTSLAETHGPLPPRHAHTHARTPHTPHARHSRPGGAGGRQGRPQDPRGCSRGLSQRATRPIVATEALPRPTAPGHCLCAEAYVHTCAEGRV